MTAPEMGVPLDSLPGSLVSSDSTGKGLSGSFILLEGGSVPWSGSITAPLQLQKENYSRKTGWVLLSQQRQKDVQQRLSQGLGCCIPKYRCSSFPRGADFSAQKSLKWFSLTAPYAQNTPRSSVVPACSFSLVSELNPQLN